MPTWWAAGSAPLATDAASAPLTEQLMAPSRYLHDKRSPAVGGATGSSCTGGEPSPLSTICCSW